MEPEKLKSRLVTVNGQIEWSTRAIHMRNDVNSEAAVMKDIFTR